MNIRVTGSNADSMRKQTLMANGNIHDISRI